MARGAWISLLALGRNPARWSFSPSLCNGLPLLPQPSEFSWQRWAAMKNSLSGDLVLAKGRENWVLGVKVGHLYHSGEMRDPPSWNYGQEQRISRGLRHKSKSLCLMDTNDPDYIQPGQDANRHPPCLLSAQQSGVVCGDGGWVGVSPFSPAGSLPLFLHQLS